MIHSPPGSAARRKKRRQAILDEARAVIHEGGLEALKLAPLAKRLGYAVGALYRYFDAKEALIVALEVEVLGELERRLARVSEAARDHAPHPPLTALLARTRRYVGFAETHPEDFALLGFAIGDPRVLVPGPGAADVFEAARPIFAEVAADLEAAAQDGLLEPGAPLDRALVLWSALQGVLQTRKLSRVAPELLDTERLAGELTRSLLRGWGAQPGALDAALTHLNTLPEQIWSQP